MMRSPPNHAGSLAWIAALALMGLSWPAQADPLNEFTGCSLVPTEWADGDSFRVRLPTGKEITLRLYGVDCPEMHLAGDESNARRLRDQRRWFGIPNILDAREVGVRAREEVFRILEEPFTVHTAFADARGDPEYQRYYGFVTTSEGLDLSEHLVAEGLARAFGVVRSRPDGTPGREWRKQLEDLEFTAAQGGRGAWALTDWDRPPEERKEAREEAAEIERAMGRGSLPAGTTLDPNRAARDELLALPGVGETIALGIIERRPFETAEDLLRVPYLGPATLEEIESYLKFEDEDDPAGTASSSESEAPPES